MDGKEYYINTQQITLITKYKELTEIRMDGTCVHIDREIKSVIEYLDLD